MKPKSKFILSVAVSLLFVGGLIIGAIVFVSDVEHKPREISVEPFLPDTLLFPGSPSTSTAMDTSASSTPPKPLGEASISSETLKRLESRWYRGGDDTFVGTTTNDYSLGYSNLFDEFSIVIVSEPSGKFREAAENELVFALGMTKDEVCELPVFVSRKTWANNFDYEEVGLSFCPGSVELD